MNDMNAHVPKGGAPYNEKAWMGESATTLHIHMAGVECGPYLGPWTTRRSTLTWGTTTCPDCLKLKPESAPWNPIIDTRGD